MYKITKEAAGVLPQKSAIKTPNISILTAGLQGLPLFASVVEKEVNGIGMGVLENGVPYLP